MNLNEILKSKGLEDDVIKSILDDMKANKIFTAAEENLDIRYGKLKGDYEDLKKNTAGYGELQGKIAGFDQEKQRLEQENQKLVSQLNEVRLDAEMRINLLSEGCTNVKYGAFLLREKGDLALDESGKIKGWEDKLAGLKTQAPEFFESTKNVKVIENKLVKTEVDRGEGEPKNLADALRMQYEKHE